MPSLPESPPRESRDLALAVAEEKQVWYETQQKFNRTGHNVTEVLLLLVTAGTTVAAALGAVPWVTASLAAFSILLNGLRKTYDWQRNWIAFTVALNDIESAIHAYRLLPEDRRDEVAQRRLLNRVDEIVAAETARWASRRTEDAHDHRESA